MAYYLCFMCWSTRIHPLIFVLVNIVSSHALSRYLEPHKEFFIWLHALGLSQSYLNSWDHHDLDIFFSCGQTLKILKLFGLAHKLEHGSLEFYIRTPSSFLLIYHIWFISSIQWSLCQYLMFIFISWNPNLEFNIWTSSNSYEQFFYIKVNKIISP
jgi:hypothetical protein